MSRRRFWIILAPFLVVMTAAVVWDVQWRLAGRPDGSVWTLPARAEGRQDATGTAPPAAQFPYVALDGSGVYHTPDCGYTNRAAESRKRYFPTAQAAEESGLRPCRYCLGGNP